MDTPNDLRVTTREASSLLASQPWETIPILKAARVPFSRCGNNYLWSRAAVEHLAMTLAARREREAPAREDVS